VNAVVTNVPGVVTAVAPRGFYMQDPEPDADPATSEGILVFTSSAPSGIARGDRVSVTGRVSEFRAGGDANNLTVTETGLPTVTVVEHGVAVAGADSRRPRRPGRRRSRSARTPPGDVEASATST
jgi:predicted extracellular nuclease